MLGAKAFEWGQINAVPVDAVSKFLLELFERWGKCGAVRVDNGLPFGNMDKDCPSILGLWLIGHDIDLILNKPRTPTQNAKVEKMQDVSSRWAEVAKSISITDLQQKLDDTALHQRAEFREGRRKGLSRLEEFPELETSRRVYKEEAFDENRVWEHLAKNTFARKTTKEGRVDILGQRVYLGVGHAHQQAMIKLNHQTKQWEIAVATSKDIIPKDATKLDKEYILDFSFYKRHNLNP